MHPQSSEKRSSPGTVVIGLLILNAVLGLIAWVFPGEEITLSDEVTLQFPDLSSVIGPDTVKTVNLDTVIADIETVDSTAEFLTVTEDTLEKPKRLIEYPQAGQSALDGFFYALQNEASRKVIRILHYGDSQLEGDRVSDYLRNRFQLTFGGYGPGIVLPLEPTAGARSTVYVRQSADWKKEAIYGNLARAKSGLYGIGGSAYRYTGSFSKVIGEDTLMQRVYATDTVGKDSLDQWIVEIDSSSFQLDTITVKRYATESLSSSWIRIRNGRKSYPRVKKYNRVKLYFGNTEPFTLSIKAGSLDTSTTVVGKNLLNEVVFKPGWVTQSTVLGFSGNSPRLQAIALDGVNGVAVDNFPMRGSSGLGFETINQQLYSRQMRVMDVRLIVLQYGINVVPNPQKSYNFYQRMFSAQLRAIKKANPQVAVLVIGPSDMSRKRGGKYVSYPNIPMIRDAMKNAAFENGCAFWDLYEAMGGENSMVSWVQSKPSLATKDFTHFNFRGAKLVGEMLYDALYYEYRQYLRSKDQVQKDPQS